MNLRYRSAAPIIAIYTGRVMKWGGGRNSVSSPKALLTNYGLPVTLNSAVGPPTASDQLP